MVIIPKESKILNPKPVEEKIHDKMEDAKELVILN